jgi:hypothetical protein
MADLLTREAVDRDEEDVYPDPGAYPIPAEARFPADGFLAADDLADIGRALVADREDFEHLREAIIAYRWRKKGGASRGRPVYGAAVRSGGLLGHFSGADFVIWLAADACRQKSLDEPAVVALVKHQLSHIQPGPEDGRLILTHHDFEGFYNELEAGAAVQPWLRPAIHYAQQLPLVELDEETDVAGDDTGEGA